MHLQQFIIYYFVKIIDLQRVLFTTWLPQSLALVIYEWDVVVASISSKIPSELSDVDVLVTKKHAGFKKTGLKVDFAIKLNRFLKGKIWLLG